MSKLRRTAALRIRMTPDERRAITDAGAAVGLGPCTYTRMVVVKAVGRKPAPPGRRRADNYAVALARWTGALGQIGNLVNQCARVHNSGGAVSAVDLTEIVAELRKLRETVLAYDVSESEQL